MACFFVVLSLLWRMYKHMQAKTIFGISARAPLEGRWQIESTSITANAKASSETDIAMDDGELRINGRHAINADAARANHWQLERRNGSL